MREKTIEYLKNKISDFNIDRRSKHSVFTCPKCKAFAANMVGSSAVVSCLACNFRGDLETIVKLLESSDTISDAEKDLGIGDFTDDILVDNAFAFYKDNKFDLVPVVADLKRPFELEWQKKNHLDPLEWKQWYRDGLNFGVKTGKISEIIVLDFDTKEIPSEIKILLGNTLMQSTTKGFHYFYRYTPLLRKTRIDSLKLDIETDGGQVVIFPSKVAGISRNIDWKEIEPMNEILISTLLEKIGNKTFKSQEDTTNPIVSNLNLSDLKFKDVNEGSRNSTLLRIGGILRKQFNVAQTETLLELLNNNFIHPKLPFNEVKEIVKSLQKYSGLDEQELAKKIYEYLKIVEECTSQDIKAALEEPKKEIDKALSFLMREGYAYRKGRNYKAITKVEWDTSLANLIKPVNFKMPYFHEVANFNWGDIILLGSVSKAGKTTSCMNVIKMLVDQGIKPYYLYLESGSRFTTTAMKLGLVEGDFYHKFSSSPESIEIEPNSVTMIDWLNVAEKFSTDAVFKALVEKTHKANAFLIVYMQVKPNGDWFAPNMCDLFVAMSAKYFYEENSNGARGYWHVKPIRDPKTQTKEAKVPCRYEWDTRRLVRIEDDPKTVEKKIEIKLPKLETKPIVKPLSANCDMFGDAEEYKLK